MAALTVCLTPFIAGLSLASNNSSRLVILPMLNEHERRSPRAARCGDVMVRPNGLVF
jgi:hypothetical protein